MTVFLFIGGLMSSGTLLHIIFQAHAVVMETDLEHQWNVLFYIAAITRSIHCILGGEMSVCKCLAVCKWRIKMHACLLCIMFPVVSFSGVLFIGCSYVKFLG